MKKLLPLILLLLIIVACSKQEKKMELFSPEAFAYSLDNEWELNLSCQIKGYTLFKNKGRYYCKLTFVVDIQIPDGSLIKNVHTGKIEQLAKEEDADIQLNVQIKLDDKYKQGTYLAIINIKDELSGKQMKIDKMFDLSE